MERRILLKNLKI